MFILIVTKKNLDDLTDISAEAKQLFGWGGANKSARASRITIVLGRRPFVIAGGPFNMYIGVYTTLSTYSAA